MYKVFYIARFTQTASIFLSLSYFKTDGYAGVLFGLTLYRCACLCCMFLFFCVFMSGHRHVLVHVNMWMRDVALMLDKEFKSQGVYR